MLTSFKRGLAFVAERLASLVNLLKGIMTLASLAGLSVHVISRDSLEREPDLADLRRPYTPEERAKYGNRSTPQEREMARTYQLVEQTKNLWATAPVDFPAELKAYLRAGKPAPLMQRCLDAIPLLMQGAMPQLDARGMLTVKSISPHAPPTWTMDVPPWIHPSCGGGMKAYPEYERAMEASIPRRKKRRLSIEDLVASYEYCSWERAGNSEADYPGVSRE